MKALHTSSISLSIFLSLLALVSCKPSAEKVEEPEEAAHVEPSEWVPEDPVLLAGKKVYNIECGLCHDEGEEAAPRLAKANQWDYRIAKGEATLIDHAINGFRGDEGKMPAKGGNPDLTDEQIAQAVKFMVAAPKK